MWSVQRRHRFAAVSVGCVHIVSYFVVLSLGLGAPLRPTHTVECCRPQLMAYVSEPMPRSNPLERSLSGRATIIPLPHCPMCRHQLSTLPCRTVLVRQLNTVLPSASSCTHTTYKGKRSLGNHHVYKLLPHFPRSLLLLASTWFLKFLRLCLI